MSKWEQGRVFNESTTITGYSSAARHDVRNRSGEIIGEFQAISWGRPNHYGHVEGSIILLEVKEDFINEELTFCIDWIPNPEHAEPGETCRGYTLTGALLYNAQHQTVLTNDQVEPGTPLGFKASDVTWYSNKHPYC